MMVFFAISLFVLGAILGSFVVANVGRAKRGDRSKWSHCLGCGKRLASKDLVPVVSWVRLRGRCRYCKAKIGYMEILGEVLMGVAFVLAYLFFPFSLGNPENWMIFLIFLVLLVNLVFLGIFDAKYGLFPDKALTFAVICAIMYGVTAMVVSHSGGEGMVFDQLMNIAISVMILAGTYFFLYKVSNEKWVGSGDPILMLAVAIVLGHPFLAFVLLFLANFLASIVAVPMIRLGRKQIPFGPFIVLAFFVVFLSQNLLMGIGLF
ncbi:prepilin peptidase [Candidatus Saccharibacteria bacterium]|nr:prepilin peptidase [Candidatus Saccharibacteria bacterium]